MYSQSYHNNQFPNTFIVPKRHPAPRTSDVPFPQTPQPYAAANRLSVSVDLPLLEVSHQWNHTLSGLCIWLISLCIHVAAASALHSSLWLSDIPLCGWTTLFICW